MAFIIIGNVISLVAACFTAASSWATSTRKMFFYQMWQCLLLAIANIFFQSYAGIPVLLICVFRNYLISKGKYTKWAFVLTAAAIFVLGVIFNNRGWVGWIIIIASVLYGVGIYFLKKDFGQKINIIVNLILWMIYELIILDLVSAVTDIISLVLAFRALYVLYKAGGNDPSATEEKEAISSVETTRNQE